MNRMMIVLFVVSALTSVGHAKVKLNQDIGKVGEGTYLLIEDPLFIKKGTTSVLASRTRSKADREGRVLGPSCEIRVGRATGVNVFKKNVILKSGTKLYLKSEGNEMAFVNDEQGIRIPLICRHMVRGGSKKRLVQSPKFTVGQFAKVFSFVGTLYVAETPRRTANL